MSNKSKRTFEELNKDRKPRTRSEWIPLDGDLIERVADLDRKVRAAEREDERNGTTAASKVPRLQRELEELQQEAEHAAVQFTATSLPRKKYRKLIAEHQAGKQEGFRWNDETFPPALISACITEPAGTDGEVIWEDWDEGIAQAIYRLCLLVNEEPPKVPFSVTSTAGTADSQTSSTSASGMDEV